MPTPSFAHQSNGKDVRKTMGMVISMSHAPGKVQRAGSLVRRRAAKPDARRGRQAAQKRDGTRVARTRIVVRRIRFVPRRGRGTTGRGSLLARSDCHP